MKPTLVLYNPKSNASGVKILPMSLLALGATLEGRYDYAIVDGNCEPDALAILRSRIRQGANVLGVSVMPGPQLAQAVPHCRALKAEFPGLVVVWGGYFPTLHPEVCLRSTDVDFVLRGHAEWSLLALLGALDGRSDGRRGDLETAGLACRDGQAPGVGDALCAAGGQGQMPHPGDLPPYPYHRLDMPRYIRHTFLGSRTLPHHSSYGCPFSCNFCAVVHMAAGRWLAQSAAQVAEVAQLYAERWGVNAIEFYDNNFFVDETRTAEFAERILPLGIAWWGEGRVDTLVRYSERTWRLMRESGLKMVFMGAESGSAETLGRMHKGGTLSPDYTLAIAQKMRELGIVPEFSFVVGNPPDAQADIRQTIAFIRRLKEVNPASEIILYPYTPVPEGSGEVEGPAGLARETGFAYPQTLEEWVTPQWIEFARRRNVRTPWLPERLLGQLHDFQRVLNAYYPTSTDPRLVGMRGAVLRAASAWRYRSGIYAFPIELRLLGKLLPYRRPETSGF